MKTANPYALRQRGFSHFLMLVLMPAGAHAFFTLIFGLEADGSAYMLFSALCAAAASGAFLYKARYGLLESLVPAVWPAVLATWREWYWALGMHAPENAARTFAGALGWDRAPATAAVALLTLAAAAAGWICRRASPRR